MPESSSVPSSAKEKPIEILEMKKPPSITKTAASDEISTPEKPIQLPRRSKVAFSVKEVKEIALGLQKPQKDSIARRSDLNESGDDDELLAVEEKLKSAESSPSKSSKARSLTKLPEK